MKHKYLEEAGWTSYADNDWKGKNIWRKIKYFFKKRKTGVDPRTCFDLDTEMMLWIYEHICQFLNDADTVVDLDYHKFEYEGKTYTLKELLLKVKEYISNYMNAEDNLITGENVNKSGETDPLGIRVFEYEKENYSKVFDILKLVFPALWW